MASNTNALPPLPLPQPGTMRLRGSNPSIEVIASNLSINLCQEAAGSGSSAPYTAALTLRDGVSASSPALLHIACPGRAGSQQQGGGRGGGGGSNGNWPVTALSASDLTSASALALSLPLPLPLPEPGLSLRTWSDVACERARVDADGLHCARLTADAFTNLVGDFATATSNALATLPPSAGALAAAYGELSNMFMASASLLNGVYVRSHPDGQPRMLFEAGGASVLLAPQAPATESRAFAWATTTTGAASATTTTGAASNGSSGSSNGSGGGSNGGTAAAGGSTAAAGGSTAAPGTGPAGPETATDAMTLGPGGDLWLRGGVALGDAVRLTASGSNLGVNLPAGLAPTCALHVHGTVFSDEGMFMLSDASVKTDVRPLRGALATALSIRGCTYARVDHQPPPFALGARQQQQQQQQQRHVGVIAQDVQAVLPEAVHVGPDGRLSVAYGNLVAVTIEAIRDLAAAVADLQQQNADLQNRFSSQVEACAPGAPAPPAT